MPVDGLCLNVDAGFDSKEFRFYLDKKEIYANVCFNKSKEIQIEMNISINCFIMRDIKLRKPMLGWTDLDRY